MIRLLPSENKHIIIQEEFRKRKSKKLCILSHYDGNNKVEEYVSFMLKELYRLGFDIVMVSTAKNINKIEISKVRRYLRAFVLKKNSGYDFFSWKIGMGICQDFDTYDELLLINDSIFFPLQRPKKVFDTMKRNKYDFWGLLDSHERRYHIQSFFWFFNKKIKKSNFFTSFWSKCTVLDDKITIIHAYETMFTSLVMKNDFHVGSYIETKKVIADLYNLGISVQENEILFYSLWQYIIMMVDAPLLKKNILCGSHQDFNPLTYNWKDVIDNSTTYNSILIANYLKRCQIPILEKNMNWIERLLELIDHITLLKENNTIVIYGYAYVGKLMHSILNEHVSLIVDRNFEHLSDINFKQVFSIDAIPKAKYNKILICSFGREDEVISILNQYNIKRDKIIIVQDFLNEESLLLSHFITKLLKIFHNVIFHNAVGSELQFYKTDIRLIRMANNYLQFFNMPILKTYDNESKENQNSMHLINIKTLKTFDMGKWLNVF